MDKQPPIDEIQTRLSELLDAIKAQVNKLTPKTPMHTLEQDMLPAVASISALLLTLIERLGSESFAHYAQQFEKSLNAEINTAYGLSPTEALCLENDATDERQYSESDAIDYLADKTFQSMLNLSHELPGPFHRERSLILHAAEAVMLNIIMNFSGSKPPTEIADIFSENISLAVAQACGAEPKDVVH